MLTDSASGVVGSGVVCGGWSMLRNFSYALPLPFGGDSGGSVWTETNCSVSCSKAVVKTAVRSSMSCW